MPNVCRAINLVRRARATQSMPILKLVFPLVLALTVLLTSGAFGQDTDFQVWNETTVIIPLIREKKEGEKPVTKISLQLSGGIRIGQNRLFPVDKRLSGGFDIKLNKYFSFSPSYSYRAAEARRGRREFEHRIRFDFTMEKKWSGFSIKDRHRIERRIRNSRSDSTRYRNKITLKVPVKREGKELFAPYGAEEIFYDFTDSRFTSNRIFAGLSRKLSSTVSADFFYVFHYNRFSLPKYIHGVGMDLKITLP